jgi:CheY-like chemotaxis protein
MSENTEAAPKQSILVVDDELGICDFLRTFFTRRGYAVHTECNAQDALGYLAEQQPFVMLLDIRMPGMSGLEALEIIHKEWPDIKVIMVTAFADEALMAQARAQGAVDYITKPFSLEYLDNEVLQKLHAL